MDDDVASIIRQALRTGYRTSCGGTSWPTTRVTSTAPTWTATGGAAARHTMPLNAKLLLSAIYTNVS